jgi:hypothetical protein
VGKYLPDIRRGDTYRVKIQYPAGTDITGYTHWLTLRTGIGINPAALSVRSDAGDHVLDVPASGTAYLEATPDQTAALVVGKGYVYDVQVRTNLGEIKTLLPPITEATDRLVIVPDVTTDVV